MHIGGSKGGRQSTFELNLVPFIDVLSTCICFLLITTVFLQLGTVDTQQALGSESSQKKKDEQALMAAVTHEGGIRFWWKEDKSRKTIGEISGQGGRIQRDAVENWISAFSKRYPQVQTAMVLPQSHTKYDNVIQLMATLKKNKIDQVGVAPL